MVDSLSALINNLQINQESGQSTHHKKHILNSYNFCDEPYL